MTGDSRRYRRRWVRLENTMALPLPDGRYGVAMQAAGAWCPCAEGRAECWWAAVFLAESDGTLGFWNDLLEESWHHTSEKSARSAIEDRYFPDITDVRKADVKRLVAIVSTKDRPSREAAEAVIAAASSSSGAGLSRRNRPRRRQLTSKVSTPAIHCHFSPARLT